MKYIQILRQCLKLQVYHSGGAVIEKGFLLINLIFKDWRSSTNTQMLDALIRLHYMMIVCETLKFKVLYQCGWREDIEESKLHSLHSSCPAKKCIFKVKNTSAIYKDCSTSIIAKTPKYWWGQSALCVKLWTDIPSNVFFINFEEMLVKSCQELMGFSEKLPIGKCSWK